MVKIAKTPDMYMYIKKIQNEFVLLRLVFCQIKSLSLIL